MAARGQPAYRGDQIFQWIHGRGVLDPAKMTNLPKTLREGLDIAPAMAAERMHRSEDNTRKLLLRMSDGAAVETVLLPASSKCADANAAAEDDADATSLRVTQCISTQVGCAMGCVFCASGIAGLKRHMTAGEIVSQLFIGRDMLEEREQLRSVVFMGMGEPLHNYEAVARAIRLMIDPAGLALSPKRITVSTSGLIPEIDKLGADFGGEVNLALSLHNADDEARSRLMPINDKYPLKPLMAALRRYPKKKRRKITIEYTLVAGQNDSLDDAARLARLLKGIDVKVNLIPMNPIEHSKLGPPAMDRVHAFQKVLTGARTLCFIRRRRGDDVSAACGQLVMLGEGPNRAFVRRQPE